MKKFIRDINGLFNPGELESISEDQLADEAFREMDADGNGLITEEEFIKAAMKDNKVCKMLTLKVVNLISPWSISQIKDSEIFGFRDMFEIWAFTLLERRSLLITYVKIKEKMAIYSICKYDFTNFPILISHDITFERNFQTKNTKW